MSELPRDWKKVYESLRQEPSLAKQLELCQRLRALMQDRTLELAASGGGDPSELKAIDDALQDLWVLEEAIRKKIN